MNFLLTIMEGQACKRVDGGRGQGYRRSDLLSWLNLVLQRRGIRRDACKRRTIRRRGMDGLQLWRQPVKKLFSNGTATATSVIPVYYDTVWPSQNRPRRGPTSSSVSRPGQNSKSSSRSNDRPASNLARNAVTAGASASSLMLFTPRNCLWECCVASLGARRDRPPWWVWIAAVAI